MAGPARSDLVTNTRVRNLDAPAAKPGVAVEIEVQRAFSSIHDNLIADHAFGILAPAGNRSWVGFNDIHRNAVDARDDRLGPGNRFVNPGFVNLAGDDFHLGPASPVIDRGTALDAPDRHQAGRPRPRGRGFDVGACERR